MAAPAAPRRGPGLALCLSLLLLAPARGARAAAARMLVNQSEQYAVYDSVGTTVVDGAPFFVFADWLNPPLFADLFDASGNLVWSFTNTSAGGQVVTFLTDTARHCEPSPQPGALAVDVFVAVIGNGGVVAFGLNSAAKTAAPVWSVALPGCGESKLPPPHPPPPTRRHTSSPLPLPGVKRDPRTPEQTSRAAPTS